MSDFDPVLTALGLCEAAYTIGQTGACDCGPGFSPAEALTLAKAPPILRCDPESIWGFKVRLGSQQYVVFRGTQGCYHKRPFLNEWFADALALAPRSWSGPGRAHYGFRTLYEAIRHGLGEVDSNAILLGHSLGAAIASLALADGYGGSLTTFAGPMAGDKEFAASLDGSKRYVNAPDVVWRMPGFWPYVHGGEQIMLRGPGTFFTEITSHSLQSHRAGYLALKASPPAVHPPSI